MRQRALIGGIATALILAPMAAANPPALSSVGSQGLHPTAMFSAPRSDFTAIYLATKPDRATDGAFLQENVKVVDILTTSEIQSGQWEYQDQVDPGTYYVLLDAQPDLTTCQLSDGTTDPACADGYSNVLTLTIPMPAIRYIPSATVEAFASSVQLTLIAKPLGDKEPYRVCYLTKAKARRCLSSALDGYDWSDASGVGDTLTASTQNLAASTAFTWYVAGKPVARKRVRVRVGR